MDGRRLTSSRTRTLSRQQHHTPVRAQVLGRRGADIAFVAGGSSLLAVAGADERGGAVILVDTLAPPASARIARLHGHQVRAAVHWDCFVCPCSVLWTYVVALLVGKMWSTGAIGSPGGFCPGALPRTHEAWIPGNPPWVSVACRR